MTVKRNEYIALKRSIKCVEDRQRMVKKTLDNCGWKDDYQRGQHYELKYMLNTLRHQLSLLNQETVNDDRK